jgi:hypothetical protein
MSPKVKIALTVGVGGWCFVHLPNREIRLYVRFEPFNDEVQGIARASALFVSPSVLRVAEIFIDGDGKPVTAQFSRSIPVSAIELLANSSELVGEIYEGLEARGYVSLDLARQLSHFENIQRNSSRKEKKIKPPEIPFETLRRVAISRPTSLDDEFLARVAEFYRVTISLHERPIKKLSESANVPRDTAARWVKLARERGFLSSPNGEGESNDGQK